MNIEEYIELCRKRRQTTSFAFLAERCPTSADAPYRIRVLPQLSPDKTCVLVLTGTGGKGIYLRGCNSMLKQVDTFVKNNIPEAEEKIQTCVAVCDFGQYHLDKVARHAEYEPEAIHELTEPYQHETLHPAYINDIFQAVIVPRISQNHGSERLPQTEALKNIRRLNIVAHCHGGYVALKLEQLMTQKMSELQYSAAEQKQLKSQLLTLAYNPECPKMLVSSKMIAIESAQDNHSLYNDYLKEWLLMSHKDFGVGYFPKWCGRTFVCAQVDKAGIEGNPPRKWHVVPIDDYLKGIKKPEKGAKILGEHTFLGFEPTENMSRGAHKLQLFANNILLNTVKNSLQQTEEGEYIPLPNIQNLAANTLRQKYEFAGAVLTGYKLQQQMALTRKSKIENFAAYRRSLPTVEL